MPPGVIVLYDIPSLLPGSAWSPNTWKARYCLNYKGLPYRTVWVEYPDIAAVCKAIGIPPTVPNPDGSDRYTLPAIHDPSTGASIADSLLIGEYLDDTYPDTPKVFPAGTRALQHAFLDAHRATLSAIWQFALPASVPHLSGPSQEFYRHQIIEPAFGKTVEDLVPAEGDREEQWQKLKSDFAAVDGWMKSSRGEGPFVMGNTISFADFAVGAFAWWIKRVYGDESAQWKDMKSWYGGLLDALLNGLEKYDVIV